MGALGIPVIDWWHDGRPETSLHQVATTDGGQIVGDLQAVDRGFPEPTRRPGQCHFSLVVASDCRRQGIGGTLYAAVETFARHRQARLLYTSFMDAPEAPAAPFLRRRGFEPLERFHPSFLDLAPFEPVRFEPALRRVEAQGIRLCTYAEMGDTSRHRQCLYKLEQAARASQPFREVLPYVPTPFDEWQEEFNRREPATVFIAISASTDTWAGVVTGLEWYFTGVHPDWRGRGIAMALKVLCLATAKKRDITRMETENHEDNAAMLAINRKLGFVFTTPEVAYAKRLSW